ncbi:serine--tRNA ligase [Candidatus Peregrinibacteria bacterium]|nr:serine--tRNA ligase [Candidatus Peregrinibacteria bacterium]
MLELKLLRENPDHFKKALAKKKVKPEPIDEIIKLDQERRAIMTKSETLQAEANKLSKEIPSASTENRPKLVEQSKKLKEEIKALEPELARIESAQNEILFGIPNIPHDSVPEGKDEHDNVEIKRWGKIPEIANPIDHTDLGKALDILDLDRATKITGTRFAIFKGLGAKLERALAAFMLDTQSKAGYDEVIPPYLVNAESLFGTGQLPKFEEDLFKVPHNDTSLYLIPTAEVPVTNIYRDEILDEAKLPIRHCALTPCFRSEAGSYGRDTKGIIRQHQFHKVELVSFTTPETAEAELERLTSHAEAILEALELPYRKVLLCGGDMGFGSHKTYDLEVWVPSQNTYREISSCSWFSDFQGRRAAIRYKGESTAGKTQIIHTLNGSGLAVGRTWVAVVENYQQPDGSILIPKALQPYMNGINKIG